MGSTPYLRLLPLLLLLLPHPLIREYLSTNLLPKDVGVDALHPIVLLPGVSCSNLEARLTEAYRPSTPHCGAMKGKGWFGLWENSSSLLAHNYVHCFKEQMSLVYDPTVNDYRNRPGVETRVPNFGSAQGFHEKNPLHPEWCLTKLRDALERIGYRDGETLFGAPYDMRYVPPLPGQPSEFYSRYFKQLMVLIENVSRKKQREKVILFGHSFGGMVALEFVRNTPLAWRSRYIKHLILAAPVLSQGFIEPLKNLVSGPDMLYVPTATAMSLRAMWRSFETAIMFLPSREVFRHKPLVITKKRNYTTYDMEEILKAIGFSGGVQAFKRRALPNMLYFQAPMVPVTCINGVGNRTPQQLIYWDSNFSASPEFVYGDGDGKINLISMLVFDEKMSQDPEQKKQYKSIKLHKAKHDTVITDECALKRVIQEILGANRISS
ncbi:hypothetical protein ACP70R_039235 [Stipagrostis hirtigluma subsp. patula]